mgnify:CR=1 FL=1
MQQPFFSSIPRDRLTRCEEILMGALLREPFNVSQRIGELRAVPLSFSGKLAPAFAEILAQFAQFGRYSPLTIQQKCGVDVSFYAANDTDIDLAWAISEWWDQYQIWGEATALMQGVNEGAMSGGAIAMRGEVEATRDKLGLNGAVSTTSPADEFMTWGSDKLDGNEKRYITTPHLIELQSVIHDFVPGDLWLLAARPSMGKSQAALNLLSHFYDIGAKGLFVSLEMSGASLLKRLLGIRHGINARGDWSTLDPKIVGNAISETASIEERIKIVNGLYTVSEIEAAAISAHHQGNLQFLIIDYLQLMVATGNHNTKNDSVGSISGALVRLANRLKIPVIALSQLSRDVEKRGGSKRPQLSDLRDSGSLEQDAAGVIFLHRPEYYSVLEDEQGNSLIGVAEWIVAKQRNGPIETVLCDFNPIRGFKNKAGSFESKPTSPPTDFTVPISARPSTTEDIPF